jgi:hypothetical protein
MAVHASRQGRRHLAIWVAAFTASLYTVLLTGRTIFGTLFATSMAVKLFVHCSSCESAGKTTCGHLGCGIHSNFIYYWQNRQSFETLFATLTTTKLFVHCHSCEPTGNMLPHTLELYYMHSRQLYILLLEWTVVLGTVVCHIDGC